MSISQKNRIFLSKWEFLANLGKKKFILTKKSDFFGKWTKFLGIFPSVMYIKTERIVFNQQKYAIFVHIFVYDHGPSAHAPHITKDFFAYLGGC